MIDPTPEQIEAEALERFPELDPTHASLTYPADAMRSHNRSAFESGARWAAREAAAGALLVAPALSVREDRSQSGDADRNGGEDGPEHEWGSHPETVAADTAELIAEARALAGRKVEDSADAEALQIMLGLLCDRLEAPVLVDEDELAGVICDALGHTGDRECEKDHDAVRAVLAHLRGGGQ